MYLKKSNSHNHTVKEASLILILEMRKLRFRELAPITRLANGVQYVTLNPVFFLLHHIAFTARMCQVVI